jgi:hypothetical protein
MSKETKKCDCQKYLGEKCPKCASSPDLKENWEIEFINRFADVEHKLNNGDYFISGTTLISEIIPHLRSLVSLTRTQALQTQLEELIKMVEYEMSFDTGKDQFSRGCRTADKNILSRLQASLTDLMK